ncbi:carbohydrate ABC transporter permease [uncultured Pseudokineococcus sp.]|uniref:carbohydrate ABC transporter permease n=1 Tax=uncultured Pseudokineococcus sp. TaxID=1642928 RepID=UPI002631519E|nr:sugar ABC transporter permease [uncultured Pseudokineococcus sp.]
MSETGGTAPGTTTSGDGTAGATGTGEALATAGRDAGGSSPPRRRRGTRSSRTAPWLFLAPALALFGAFLLVPILYAVWLSLRSQQRAGGGIVAQVDVVFVGVENYARAVTDPALYDSLGRMLLYGLMVVPTMLGLALVFALLLDLPRVRLRSATRIAIFLPYAVPGVIASLLWGFLYLPRVSPVRETFLAVGLPAPDFFTSTSVFFSVANIAVWGGVGFNMIILYTSLRSVPAELYDSARVDGCTEWQVATRIKLPLLAPALVMTGVFSMIATLQVFNEPQTLSPLTNVISSDWMPLQKIYTDAFVRNDIYTAAATSVLLALVTLVLSLLTLTFLQRRAFGDDA